MSLTMGPAHMLARTTTNENGIDTLRLLKAQYGETKRRMMISMLMRIMLPNCDEAKFVEHITRWPCDTAAYERVVIDRLLELLKPTLLITKTSGPMYRDLCMQVNVVHKY